ncbi:MAG: cupin domain-containing protein [Pelagibacterium sp.]|uniref:cupin domain-containing protein n=1 Tax=Pelagibacterium sp. TaxID=1967288 RepID=UPI0032EBB0F1
MAMDVMTDVGERKALAEELDRYNCRVAQPDDPPLFTKTPASSMKALHWKWADLENLLDKIGQSLKLEKGGQRRTLRLSNPGLPFGTTPTIWCSIQYILPGEIADPHRHSATALRFIMQGEGADTIVNGEQFVINEGDLVLTPSWTWHDHEHKGDKPMIWLDVLDVSLVRHMHAVFFEGSDLERQEVNRISDASYRQFGSGLMRPMHAEQHGGPSPVLAYTKARAEDALDHMSALDPDPFDDTLLEYQNPMTGGPALPTIGTAIQKLRPGMKGKPHRHTGSVVYYIVRGQGKTTVEGDVFEWGKGDFIAVPPWAAHAHENRSSSDDAVMFQVNDIPALKALGLYRESAA